MTDATATIGFAMGIVAAAVLLAKAGMFRQPERRCLHYAGGLGCQNTTTNISGYCDDCKADWGPGI